MDIIFKGRRTDVQDRFRRHASAKLGRIEKLDHKAIRVDVEVSTERNPRQSSRRERVELTIRSRGPVIRAEAAADDRFAALDRALAKLEERLRRSGDRRKAARHGTQQAGRSQGAPATPSTVGSLPPAPRSGLDEGAGAALAAGIGAGTEPGDIWADGWHAPARDTPDAAAQGTPDAVGSVPIQMEGDGPVVVKEKFHPARPMSVDQALLEMELVGHDFFLFRDERCGLPSVVYRRHGYQYGLIRLVEQAKADMAAQRGASARR